MSEPRPDGLVSLREAAEALGVKYDTLRQAMIRNPDRWPSPEGRARLTSAPKPSALYDLDALREAADRDLWRPRPWSDADLEVVRDVSLTAASAALRLGRSASAVAAKRSELEIRRPPGPEPSGPPRSKPKQSRAERTRATAERAVVILARLDGGESGAAVAADLGVTRQAIAQMVKEWRPRIVSRAEASEALGYSPSSLTTMMSRNPDRWPAPVGRRKDGRTWKPVYDLHAMIEAAGHTGARSTRIGDGATISDDDGLLTCLECGRRFRGLGSHLRRAHGLTGAEYREAHGLPVTAALSGDGTRRLQQDEGRARRDAGELAHLAPYQSPEHLREIGQEKGSEDPSAASRDHEAVKRNRRPGQEHAVVRMVAARARKLDEAARAHGYLNAADAVEKTLGMPAKAAARATGLSPQTITRRRAERDADPRA